MDKKYIIMIAIIVCVVLIALRVIIVVISKKKKSPRVKVDDEFINNLIESYGGSNNIAKVETDNGRLKIEVKDLDIVNLDGIKAQALNGVFVTGNIIKTLFRLDSNTIKAQIEKRI